MDYVSKLIRKISIKSLFVHAVGLIASMSIIWGVSYLILVTFSIQESTTKIGNDQVDLLKTATSTIKNKTSQGASTASTTKVKTKK